MMEVLAIGAGTTVAIEAGEAITKLVESWIFEEVNLAWNFEDQLASLKNKLLYFQAFFLDVENRMHEEEKSHLFNLWLQKVKDAAYFADNVLDEYAHEILRRNIELRNPFRKKMRNLFSLSNPFVFRFRMSYKVREVLSKLNELEKEAQILGLQQVPIATKAPSTSSDSGGGGGNANLYQVRKHASASASEFVGRNLDEEKLLHMLCGSSNEKGGLSTIAIIGIGGVGKTSLARRLYDNGKVDRHFAKKKVWICASDKFDVERLLKEMVESLTSRKCDLVNIGAIIKTLQTELEGNKYLLVLDDVWNNNKGLWDSLKSELQNIGGTIGSMILFTTRSHEVVEKAGAVYTHKLEGLSKADSWTLFKGMLSLGELSNQFLFEDVGRRIVEKCEGIPLAIKVMGGLLQSKENLSEWEAIEGSELWVLPQDDENYILPTLLLSFNHLPYFSLKQCFAYCAIFPKGCLIEKCELIALWLAQGLLDKVEMNNLALTMEEIGEKYLNILVSNLFLHQVRGDEESEEVFFYQMHNLVHDLALYVSQKDLLLWKTKAEVNNDFNHRHIVFTFMNDEALPSAPQQERMHRVRTVSIRGGVPCWDIMIIARYMRTLILADIGLKEVSPIIGKLKHLRYLDLSYNPIDSLPDSMTELYQLQTMMLRGCRKLKELPRDLHTLVNLRHILTSNKMRISKGLQQLTCLQTLPPLELCNGEGWTIDELEPLNEVKGHISISGLEHVKSKAAAKKAGLWKKDKVSKVSLIWGVTPYWAWYNRETTKDVLEGLEPHRKITSLELFNFGGVEFPSWVMTMAVKNGDNLARLNSLTVLKLDSCKCKQLPILGHLPLLRILKLKQLTSLETIGSEFYASEQGVARYQSHNTTSTSTGVQGPKILLFPSLRALEICNLFRLKTWKPPPMELEAFTFCNLEDLQVVSCNVLEMIPALNFQSLKFLRIDHLSGTKSLDVIKCTSGLTSLELSGLTELRSLPRELSNCTNLQNLQIYGCRNLSLLHSGLNTLIYLETMEVSDCPALVFLPHDLFIGLSSLRELTISDCINLRNIPLSLQICTSLEKLDIHNCPSIQDPIPNLSEMKGLVMLNMVNSGKFMASARRSIVHLHCLKILKIEGYADDDDFQRYLSELSVLLGNKTTIEYVKI